MLAVLKQEIFKFYKNNLQSHTQFCVKVYTCVNVNVSNLFVVHNTQN